MWSCKGFWQKISMACRSLLFKNCFLLFQKQFNKEYHSKTTVSSILAHNKTHHSVSVCFFGDRSPLPCMSMGTVISTCYIKILILNSTIFSLSQHTVHNNVGNVCSIFQQSDKIPQNIIFSSTCLFSSQWTLKCGQSEGLAEVIILLVIVFKEGWVVWNQVKWA